MDGAKKIRRDHENTVDILRALGLVPRKEDTSPPFGHFRENCETETMLRNLNWFAQCIKILDSLDLVPKDEYTKATLRAFELVGKNEDTTAIINLLNSVVRDVDVEVALGNCDLTAEWRDMETDSNVVETLRAFEFVAEREDRDESANRDVVEPLSATEFVAEAEDQDESVGSDVVEPLRGTEFVIEEEDSDESGDSDMVETQSATEFVVEAEERDESSGSNVVETPRAFEFVLGEDPDQSSDSYQSVDFDFEPWNDRVVPQLNGTICDFELGIDCEFYNEDPPNVTSWYDEMNTFLSGGDISYGE